MADRVGQQFGNYRLIRPLQKGWLAQGHFAQGYLGEHIHLKTQVAVKVLWYGLDGWTLEQFYKEVQIIAELKHPNILQILDFGVENYTPFLVIDIAFNSTLREQYSKGTILPLTTVVSYTKQIANALQYLHNLGRIHNYIRPESVLQGQNNNILLGGLDTGIADRDWGGYEYSMPPDALRYASPEQMGRTRPASDQYALGLVVYEWLCGELPFNEIQVHGLPNSFFQRMQTLPVPLHEKAPSTPSALEEAVMKALAKDPQQRFASVQEFADALEQASLPPKIISITPDRVGQQFGNYRLIRLLGKGGFADVYLGQHRRLNTYAAIKLLHTRLSNDDIEKFQKEAQTIANLRHPSIVRVLDFDVEGNIPFLVMDHAPHGTLRQRHPPGSRVPLPAVVSYVKQVVDALQYAHDQKMIHRDIKPENMLLGPNHEVLLSDFGIAVVGHSSRYLSIQDTAGTIHYMAPEQIQGKPRRASDQYALGIVVYEWLTGSRPFNGTYMEIVGQHLGVLPPPLREKNPIIPPAVAQVVMIALAKDPQQRFGSVKAFANALEQASPQKFP
jgi:serine/threonine protein kinase